MTMFRSMALFALIGVAALWRLWGINELPMHADEATQAQIFSDLLEGREFKYDPTHHHGPLQHYGHWIVAKLAGVHNLRDLEPWELRLSPILYGLATLSLLSFYLYRVVGFGAACMVVWIGGFLPLMIQVHRTAIHESLYVLSSLCVVIVLARGWAEQFDTKRALLVGTALGACLATKETWVIAFVAGLVATFSLKLSRRDWFDQGLNIRFCGFIIGMSGLVAWIIFTGFGKNPGGAWDAIRAFWIYETDTGHHKAWDWYFQGVLGFQWLWKRWWGAGGFCLLSLMALYHLFKTDTDRRLSGLFFLGLWGWAQIIIYSIIPYKTPWLMLLPLSALLPLVAWFIWRQVFERKQMLKRILWGSLCVVWIVGEHRQSMGMLDRWAVDDRQPYVYVPSSRDLKSLEKFVQDRIASSNQTNSSGRSIAVVGEGTWPLPWYLRRVDGVGYYDVMPEGEDWPIYLFVGEPHPEVEEKLLQTHDVQIWGLRPGVVIRGYFKLKSA